MKQLQDIDVPFFTLNGEFTYVILYASQRNSASPSAETTTIAFWYSLVNNFSGSLGQLLMTEFNFLFIVNSMPPRIIKSSLYHAAYALIVINTDAVTTLETR